MELVDSLYGFRLYSISKKKQVVVVAVVGGIIVIILLAVISLMGLFLACPSGSTGGNNVEANKNPAASDYTATGTGNFPVDAEGTKKEVTVTLANSAGSPGKIIVYYAKDGENKTLEAPTATIANIGFYTVTFDVEAAPGWNAAKGFSAGLGFVNITNNDLPIPKLEDFDISAFPKSYTTDNLPSPSARPTIKGLGKYVNAEITIWYRNTAAGGTKVTDFPSAVGTYDVTFDVKGTSEWNAVGGLQAGSVFIVPPGGSTVDIVETKFGDFTFTIGDPIKTFESNGAKLNVEYNKYPLVVNIANKNSSDPKKYPLDRAGAVVRKYFRINDDGTDEELGIAPTDFGSYKVEIKFAPLMNSTSTMGWTDFTVNFSFDITKRFPRVSDYEVLRTIQAEAGNSWQTGATRPVYHVFIERKPTAKRDANPGKIITKPNSTDPATPIDGFSSPYKISIYYEPIGAPEKPTIGPVKETDAYFGNQSSPYQFPTNQFPTNSSTTPNTSPPQDMGTYRVWITVDGPGANDLNSATPSVVQDAKNWAGTPEGVKLDMGTLEIKPLVGVDPDFVNIWVDDDKGILDLTSTGGNFIVMQGSTLGFTVSTSGNVVEWRVDGIDQNTTAKTFVLDSAALGVGAHEVSITVSQNKLYSQSFPVIVLARK